MWLVREMSPLLSAMRNGCFGLLPVSIEVIVVLGRGVRRQADVQPLPKLCQPQEACTGTHRRANPELVLGASRTSSASDFCCCLEATASRRSNSSGKYICFLIMMYTVIPYS